RALARASVGPASRVMRTRSRMDNGIMRQVPSCLWAEGSEREAAPLFHALAVHPCHGVEAVAPPFSIRIGEVEPGDFNATDAGEVPHVFLRALTLAVLQGVGQPHRADEAHAAARTGDAACGVVRHQFEVDVLDLSS